MVGINIYQFIWQLGWVLGLYLVFWDKTLIDIKKLSWKVYENLLARVMMLLDITPPQLEWDLQTVLVLTFTKMEN